MRITNRRKRKRTSFKEITKIFSEIKADLTEYIQDKGAETNRLKDEKEHINIQIGEAANEIEDSKFTLEAMKDMIPPERKKKDGKDDKGDNSSK